MTSFWNNKKVFITGHTGFKGSWLSLWLNHLGADVYGYGLSPATEPNLFRILNLEQKIKSSISDIRDLSKVKSAISEVMPEIVFHLAAQPLVRKSYQDPVETFSTNIMGTVNFLESVRACRSIKSAVIVTSDKCYENKEWAWPYRENEPMGGFDPYSSSKGCAELIASSYRNSFFSSVKRGEYSALVATARAGNVIGGGDWSEDRLIPDIVKSINKNEKIVLRNPSAIRPWQHVLDSLYGYMTLANKLYLEESEYADSWNFGPSDKDSFSVEEMLKKFLNAYGLNSNYEINKSASLVHEANYLKLDSSKAKAKLNWKTKWETEESVERTAKWYKSYFSNKDMTAYSLNEIEEHFQIN